MNAEMQEFLKAMEGQIDNAVKAAVAAFAPPGVVPVADAVIDAVDAYIIQLQGGTPPATVAPLTLDVLAKHVAALTVATGHGTSASMPAIKTATVSLAPAPAPATEVAEAA